MKKIACAAFLLTSLLMNAQDNVIKINPLAILGGSDLVSYEKVITDNSSVILGVGYSQFKLGEFDYSNMGAELQYRYYLSEVLSGWYAGGQAGYSKGKVDLNILYYDLFAPQDMFYSDDSEVSFNSFKIGAKFGHQWVWNSGFSLDLNLGVAYNTFKYSENTYLESLQGSGVLPNLGLALGYSF